MKRTTGLLAGAMLGVTLMLGAPSASAQAPTLKAGAPCGATSATAVPDNAVEPKSGRKFVLQYPCDLKKNEKVTVSDPVTTFALCRIRSGLCAVRKDAASKRSGNRIWRVYKRADGAALQFLKWPRIFHAAGRRSNRVEDRGGGIQFQRYQ